MQALLPHVFRGLLIGIIGASIVAWAQDAPPPAPPDAPAAAPATSNNGWKRVGDSVQTYQPPAPPNQSAPANAGQQPYPQQPAYQPPPIPASLAIPRGTFLVVRVNQILSSDKNQTGDAFSASLAQPVVACSQLRGRGVRWITCDGQSR